MTDRNGDDDLQWIIDRVPVGVVTHNPAAEITLCNEAAIGLLGRPREQLLHRRLEDLALDVVDSGGRRFAPERHPIVDALQLRRPIEGTVLGVARGDDRVWLRVDAFPRLDAGGEVVEVVCTITDVGERGIDPPGSGTSRDPCGVRGPACESRFAIGLADDAALMRLFPGRGPVTRELRERIVEAASIRKLPVLILGERGTGKALVARAVHDLSPRVEGPYVAIDCTAIPTPLFESELFGHRKGAFTGAISDKPGLFTQANGGTLFLDEIAELPLDVQPKLLMAIQDRRIRQVGSLKQIPVDVRIIAATNADLVRMMRETRFREDLYDRLNGVQILVPPLRARGDDMDAYVDRFVESWAAEEGTGVPLVDEAVRDAFRRYPWPGNVRQLDMTIGRMVAKARGAPLTLDLVPPEIATWTPAPERGAADSHAPRASGRPPTSAAIARMLKRHRYNKTRAAKALGISRDSLKRRVKRDSIPDKPPTAER